jgi:hypothetical protein
MLLSRNFKFNVDQRGLTLSTIAAFLRLGHKYEMEFLCAEATTRLAYEFPSTLQRWDAVQNSYTLVTDVGPICDVINLARANNTPKLDHIIPAAFYLCCRNNDFKKVFGDFEAQDAQPANYNYDDQKAFILGWESLVQKQVGETFSWLSGGNTSNNVFTCMNKKTCSSAKQTLQLRLFLPRTECIALRPWQSDWERNMCEHCISAAKRSHQEGRQRIWNELPTFFGLPGWDNLIDRDGTLDHVDGQNCSSLYLFAASAAD